jgi:predicted porin
VFRPFSAFFPRLVTTGALTIALSARAVYAPIPEQEQGKDLTVVIRAGVSHDTNLFGAPPAGSIPTVAGQASPDPVESAIFTLAPRISYNASVTDQTFMSASYGLTLDYFLDRPGDKFLDSHDVAVRLAHAFSKSTNIDITNSLTISKNPESLLPGVATLPGVTPDPTTLNPDQSNTRNQLDGRFVTPLNAKIGVTIKGRAVYYDYRNASLGRNLDRIENLYGIAGDYAILPELKAVAEYRHQDVFYRKEGEVKNKRSDYAMGGVDYDIAKKLMLSSRVGVERRVRAAEDDATVPYAELSGKYDYAEASFVIAGYAHTLEETSDTRRFTDMRVNRFFVNVQHSLTALIVASGSFTYEPSVLQGRAGVADIDEDTVRFGAALSYLPSKNWMISASYDYDQVFSGDAPRDMERHRVGLNATYTF